MKPPLCSAIDLAAEVELFDRDGVDMVTVRWIAETDPPLFFDQLFAPYNGNAPVLAAPTSTAWLLRRSVGAKMLRATPIAILDELARDNGSIMVCRMERLPEWSLVWEPSGFSPYRDGFPGHPALTVPLSGLRLLDNAVARTAKETILTHFRSCLEGVLKEASRIGW
jgi:hypothetical protein